MPITRQVKKGLNPQYFVASDGSLLRPPNFWQLLPPGDAAITKALKALGPHWVIVEKKGNKTFSHGVLAPAENIEIAKKQVEEKRSAPNYQNNLQQAQKRRTIKESIYTENFHDAVVNFLNFAPQYLNYAQKLAQLVTAHATPVNSGTVARSSSLSIEEKAHRAVTAWLRHKTTQYDNMKIARVKGKRGQVRSELAKLSYALLENYRCGNVISDDCPIKKALNI
ncbi:MAG: DUF2293 domain-containing protein [Lentisphaeria bacterium]